MTIENQIYNEGCLTGLKNIPDKSVNCCITSPPYFGLRDYGVDGQIGLEETPEEYVQKLVDVFREVKRVLRDDGTCYVNLGDTFNGTKVGNTETKKNKNVVTDTFKKEQCMSIGNKSLLMIPERFAIKMIDNGWILRNQIIWHKPNQMPQSATDRFTVDFEKIFFFVKQSTGYYFEQQLEPYTEPMNRWAGDNLEANGKSDWDNGTGQSTYRNRNMRPNPDGKNMRTVWSINTKPFPDAHFAIFPETLVERMIKSGCPENGIVLDPFGGAGTTAVVSVKNNRKFILYELNKTYVDDIAWPRIQKEIEIKELGYAKTKLNKEYPTLF